MGPCIYTFIVFVGDKYTTLAPGSPPTPSVTLPPPGVSTSPPAAIMSADDLVAGLTPWQWALVGLAIMAFVISLTCAVAWCVVILNRRLKQYV